MQEAWMTLKELLNDSTTRIGLILIGAIPQITYIQPRLSRLSLKAKSCETKQLKFAKDAALAQGNRDVAAKLEKRINSLEKTQKHNLENLSNS